MRRLFRMKGDIMKLKMSILSIFLVATLVITTGMYLSANDKIKADELLQAELLVKLSTQEQEIKSLNIQVEQMMRVIEAQKPIIDEYQKLSEFIDLDAFGLDQLEKIRDISENTPLDYESAMALVKYADAYDIPYSLVLSIIEHESGFRSNLVGSHQDRGYMQIIPATERYLATQFGEELGLEYDPSRIFEASYNLALGIKYLDLLKDVHGDDYERILSEYNRGPSKLAQYYEVYQTYSTAYSERILNTERKYVALNN